MTSPKISILTEAERNSLSDMLEGQNSDEEPMSNWASYIVIPKPENEKKLLYDKGLYSPASEDICNQCLSMSDSTIVRHPYYNYPAVHDPGIKEALLAPELPIIYPDDGQELYLQLCTEMNVCPVRLFYKNLLSSEINLRYYGVDPRGVRAMAMALQYNKSVSLFDLTDNFLDDDSCYYLGEMLKCNAKLRELNLAGCRIGKSGLLRLGSHLRVNHSLMSLNLARNNIGDSGGVHFAKLIATGLIVKNVNLSNNRLSQETALALMDVFEWRIPFVNFDISWNNFNHVPSTVKMFNQIANSKILQELNLSYNSLEGELVADAIYNILKSPGLTILDLSHNRFRDEAIKIIIAGLVNAKKLITLNLSCNPMTPEDAYNVLQNMLRPRVKLHNLLMDSVPVDKYFMELLTTISKMKCRKNFTVTYGKVLQNWIIQGADPRALLLKRADYLGKVNKKHLVDILLYFLKLNQESNGPIPMKNLVDQLDIDNIPLDENFIDELAHVFPGMETHISSTVDLQLICEYIRRLWPEKRLT